MIIYHSGTPGNEVTPESVLEEKSAIMLTFFNSQKKPEKRLKEIHKARKRKAANK